jgi:hypothetical protein
MPSPSVLSSWWRKFSTFGAPRQGGRTGACRVPGPAGRGDGCHLSGWRRRATNKAEAYNGYTKWLHFGGDGYLRSRDPELQEKAVKFLDLMANSIIFSTTVDMTDTLRQMAAQGREVNPDDIAALSPHRRDNVLRFGDYDTATLHIPPGPYDSALRLSQDGL